MIDVGVDLNVVTVDELFVCLICSLTLICSFDSTSTRSSLSSIDCLSVVWWRRTK